MTLEEIKKSEKVLLTPSDIAPVLGCSPYTINVQAKEDQMRGTNKLGFRVIYLKKRIKIPRIPFLEYLGIIERSDKDNDNE